MVSFFIYIYYPIICHSMFVFMSLNLLIINLLSIMSIFKMIYNYKNIYKRR